MDRTTFIGVILLGLLFTAFMFTTQMGQEQQKAGIPTTEIPLVDTPSQAEVSSNIKAIGTNMAARDTINVETESYAIDFSTYGASITSLKLKKYLDNKEPIEMVVREQTDDLGAFLMYFGADNMGQPFYGPFEFHDLKDGRYQFTARVEAVEDGQVVPFTVVKTYTLKPKEYLILISIDLVQPDGKYLPLNFFGYSYTLEALPQMGPAFTKIDGKQVYRHAVSYNGKKMQTRKYSNKPTTLDTSVNWAGIDSKYFTVLGVPDAGNYRQLWTSKAVGTLPGNQFAFVRSQIRSSIQQDNFAFYIGPKQETELTRYNKNVDNAFGVDNLHLEKVLPGGSFMGILENLLQVILTFIHRFIPNWGWSIVVLTILVRIVLFPLSLKSLKNTAHMAELQPKLKVIQEQYKDDTAKLQQEQMDLYRREGVNPAAGCLPMLLQFPILIALYGLFNRFFELRGAPFLAWITDLSVPDVLWQFGFTLPILNWQSLHVLPIIYLISQLVLTKLSQTDTSAQNANMQMMMWAFPVVFFFVLYEVSSALLLYWTMSNLLSLLQQVWVNWMRSSGRFSLDVHNQKKANKKYKINP
jgi:YidC/Oxa1 family membrane protein insertase